MTPSSADPALLQGSSGRAGRLAVLALLALPLIGCQPHDFPQYPPDYREYMYVTNSGSNTVSVYDVVNVRVDREIAVGHDPVALAPSPTRNEVFVVNQGELGEFGSISVINAETNSVVATIPVRRRPAAIALDPKGDLAYVANSGSNNLSILDLKNRREIGLIPVDQEPVALRLSPNGDSLVVANSRSGSVTIVSPASRTVRASFAGCPGADDAVILPDSSKAFVACSAGHQIMAIALAQPKTRPGSTDAVEALLDVGRGPVQIALKPDGGEVFVANSLSDSISEVITGTDDVLGAYMMGDDPVDGLVSADNSTLYVGNLHSQWVTVYSIDNGKRVGAIHVGDGPSAMAFSAAGHLLFVVDSRSGDVAVVRASSGSLFTFLPAGRNPSTIVDKAFKVH
ncbi:MAG TPA: beta-propeller fold lactonase family protein [Terracidiphilus sp.]|nr:beta-propeller fold lactonase family protein [Terracidiphilus sp.]